MNIHDSDVTRSTAMTLYDFCMKCTKVIQCARWQSCDVTTWIFMSQSSVAPNSTNATDRDHREQELNNAVQCWNERGCKRDEKYLISSLFWEPRQKTAWERLWNILLMIILGFPFHLMSSKLILGTRCESIIAPIYHKFTHSEWQTPSSQSKYSRPRSTSN